MIYYETKKNVNISIKSLNAMLDKKKFINLTFLFLFFMLSCNKIYADKINDFLEDNSLLKTSDSLIQADRMLDEQIKYETRQFKIYLSLSLAGDIVIKSSGNLRSTLDSIQESGDSIDISNTNINDNFGAVGISLGLQHNLRKHVVLSM